VFLASLLSGLITQIVHQYYFSALDCAGLASNAKHNKKTALVKRTVDYNTIA
jgi:hypothetical protein